MLCIDPSEQTAAVGLDCNTQPRTPHFTDLLLLRNELNWTCLNVKYVFLPGNVHWSHNAAESRDKTGVIRPWILKYSSRLFLPTIVILAQHRRFNISGSFSANKSFESEDISRCVTATQLEVNFLRKIPRKLAVAIYTASPASIQTKGLEPSPLRAYPSQTSD